MKWKSRYKELLALAHKHLGDRRLARSFPDLSVEQRTAPTSDRIAKVIKYPKHFNMNVVNTKVDS